MASGECCLVCGANPPPHLRGWLSELHSCDLHFFLRAPSSPTQGAVVALLENSKVNCYSALTKTTTVGIAAPVTGWPTGRIWPVRGCTVYTVRLSEPWFATSM
jgi:hypothetical protein